MRKRWRIRVDKRRKDRKIQPANLQTHDCRMSYAQVYKALKQLDIKRATGELLPQVFVHRFSSVSVTLTDMKNW